MPKLIVGLPAFNAEGTIRAAVVSTLRAMPRDSQLVVLDDRSTDGTLNVLDSIADRRLLVILSETNVGGGSARNRILAETDSELVAAMDADDVTLRWRFGLQLRALERYDLVFSSAVKFGTVTNNSHPDSPGKRRIRPSATIPLQPKEFPAALLFHSPVWHPTMAARRSAIANVGGYRPERYGQDYELWLRLAAAGARMYRLGTPVIAYRESSKQETRLPHYADSVRRNQTLGESYENLFNSVVNCATLNISSQSAIEIRNTIRTGLRETLSQFRVLNRLHYWSFLHFDRLYVTQLL